MKNSDPITESVLDFLDRLREAKIHFTLASHRDDAIMVQITVPGERWEVEFMKDGSVEVERFRSNGQITNQAELATLFNLFSDDAPPKETSLEL